MSVTTLIISLTVSLNVFAFSDECASWINRTTSAAGKVNVYGDGRVVTLENNGFAEKKNTDTEYYSEMKVGMAGFLKQSVRITRAKSEIKSIEVFMRSEDSKIKVTETTYLKSNGGACGPKSMVRTELKNGVEVKELVWDVDMCSKLVRHFDANPNDRKLGENDLRLSIIKDIIEPYLQNYGINERVKDPLKTALDYENKCNHEALMRFNEEKSLPKSKGRAS